jgi:hypothetical protein
VSLSNAQLAGGTLGVIAGGLAGFVIGKNISAGSRGDNPMPELGFLLGALAGGVLFAAAANNLGGSSQTTTTSQQSSSNSQTLPDNTQNANGLPAIPPPGA